MSSLITRYRALPALAGRALLPIGFLARLPQSMIQFGTVVLVTTSTGSLGYAGLLAGSLAVGSAVGGPLIGRLADRRGQRPVIVAASLLNALLAVALVVELQASTPHWLTMLTAVAVGGSSPQIGPLLRSRWVRLTGSDARLPTAMSFEGAADEVSFILGPSVVSVLALISPPVAVFGAALIVAVFGTWVGLHPTAALTGPSGRVKGTAAVWRNPVVAQLLLVSMAIGAFFGGSQTGVTAVATGAGTPAAAGLFYSVMAVSSAITGLATSALPVRFELRDRLPVFLGWLVVAVIPLVFWSAVPAVVVLLLILGVAVGPTMITMYSLAERQVEPERTGVTLTLISAASIVGYSVGSSLGGNLAQENGPGAAFAVSFGAVLLGSVVALRLRSVLRSTGNPAFVSLPL